MDIDVKNLHPLEVRLLRHVSLGQNITGNRIVEELGYKVGQCNQAFSWLSAKGYLIETSRTKGVFYELTDFGKEQQAKGTPAQRIFVLLSKGPKTLPEIAQELDLEKSEIGSAFGQLSKTDVVCMNEENKASLKSDFLPLEVEVAASLLTKGLEGEIAEASLSADEKQAMLKISKKRGATNSPFKMIEREDLVFQLTPQGDLARKAIFEKNITGEELGSVTAEMLSSGSWKTGTFRPYGLNAPTSRLIPGRHNSYGNYLQWVKDKLCALGFEEFDGPLVENEFWNGDALFMPQFTVPVISMMSTM